VIPSVDEHFKLLSELEDLHEISIWNELRRNGSVHVMLHQDKSSLLLPIFRSLNMQPTMMINNVQKLLDDQESELKVQARLGLTRKPHDKFMNYIEFTMWLGQMVTDYPSLATLQSIGKTAENRDVWLIKLGAPTRAVKKTAFLDFGIHAREWISPATGAYMIYELLSTYNSGGNAKTILDTWDLHIVPMLNPDGYHYSHTTNRMWRKNRKSVGSGCYGVDLNRNFDYKWNTGGSSASPCSDTFHGESPMSENEAKALERYMTGKPWTTYLTFHSYGQWWFTNWGYTSDDPPQYALLKEKSKIGTDAIQAVNGRPYTIGSSAQLLYISSGCSEDWTAGTLGILHSYCLELPPTGGTGFLAPISEIVKTGAETYAGMVAFFKSF